MTNKIKSKKGITLVALVITIVVMLLITTVTFNMILDENGVIERSKQAKKEFFIDSVKERLELIIADLQIEKETTTGKVEIADLIERGYVNSNGEINIQNLLGKEGAFGNGTNNNDVFCIELNELWYYDSNGVGNKITELGELELIPLDGKYFEIVVDEVTKEAKIMGIKEEYRVNEYYSPKNTNYCIGLKDENNNIITDVVVPGKIEYNGEEYTVTSIGGFSAHYNLTPYYKSFVLPNTLKEIQENAFCELNSLIKINIPDTVTSIGERAFMYCNNLKEIKISRNIVEIKESTFEGCSAITKLDLPPNLTKIGRYAFSRIEISELNIPKTLTIIENGAFSDCYKLSTINYAGTEEEWNAIAIDYQSNWVIQSATKNYNYSE